MIENSVAFADESVRVSIGMPMYLIAATMLPEHTNLAQIEDLLPKGAAKLHWRDLGIKAQREALLAIASLESRSTIVVAAPINPRKQERARRKCLETLLPLLEREHVETLVMESRFPSADSKDVSLYRSLKRKGAIETIGIDFENPTSEHRLWIPDQILGAYSDTVAGLPSSNTWEQEWRALESAVTVVQINL